MLLVFVWVLQTKTFHLESIKQSPNRHSKIMPFIRQQRVLFNQLNEDGDEFNSKEAQLLVNILGVLSQQLDPSSDQVTAYPG